MSSLYLQSMVDPRELAINKRYKLNTVLPASVRNAKINLMDDVFQAIMQTTTREWSPPNPAVVYLTFVFPTRKNDVDGPLKHTLDAIQDGIQKAGYKEWNDRMVDEVCVQKWVGDPVHIQIAVIPVTKAEVRCIQSS